ncbi:MAG TPA: DUF2786 domain-containing protein, partial [Acidimicrobiales bacterium]|nr:DUF2786 domain-containing protein [Acidimicrobiales bacterium]
MGKNNRYRRAAKRRPRPQGSASRPQPSPTGPRDRGDGRELLEHLLYQALDAARKRNSYGFDVCVSALERRVNEDGDAARALDNLMTGALIRSVRHCWDNGWQPADLLHAVRRFLDRKGAEALAWIVVAEARSSLGPGIDVPEAWQEQLRQVRRFSGRGDQWFAVDQIGVGVLLLELLGTLPILPRLVPPPAQWGSGGGSKATTTRSEAVNHRMLAKVRALLAKAESTTFEEEADALTAKAQELMARHAIDQAMLERGNGRVDGPSGRRIWVEDPYAWAKSRLLASVADANRCRTVWDSKFGFSTVFGFVGDLDIVEVLYTSLLVQATRAMTAAGSVKGLDGRSRTRSFRQSFMVSFAGRIWERLVAATQSATEAAGEVHGEALLPVLAGRNAMVDEVVSEVFPHLVKRDVRISN